MARVNVEVVPALARPADVERAMMEAIRLRDRAREQAEAVAAAQAAVDEQERRDVEQAAARARAGEALGSPPPALAKARAALQLAQRDLSALRLAQEQAEEAVVHAVTGQTGAWVEALDREAEEARERGRQAVTELAAACQAIGAAGGAKLWIESTQADGRYDRPVRPVVTGSWAPTSAKRTANGEALGVEEVLAFAANLLDPPVGSRR
jgi:hypothetical protein